MRFIFFFNDTATTEIYTLSLHDALPISASVSQRTILSERSVDLALAPVPSMARAYQDSVPAVVTPSSLALMKSFQVAPLFVKSWLKRLYDVAPGFLTQSWTAVTPSGSLTFVVRPVPRA